MGDKLQFKKLNVVPWLLKMTLLVAGIKAAVDLYLGWRISRAVELINPHSSSFWSWMIIVLFLLFYVLPVSGLLQYLISSDVDLLTYPKPIFYLFWGGFAFSFQVLIWIVGLDLVKLLVNYGVGINASFVDRGYGILVVGIAVLTLSYTATKMYLDTTRIEVERVELKIENLPPDLEGFKVVHISDIQADRYTGEQEIKRYIEQVNAQEPDLVVFTGDLISYGTRYIDMAAHQLSDIDARYGVYFVIGDHDYWAGTEHVKLALQKHKIPILDGKNVDVGVDGNEVRLTGLTNVYSRKAPASEVRRLLQDTTGARVKILASHQVSDLLINTALANGYNLILAGHTHGGQIRVPFFFKMFSASDFETSYIKGQYWLEKTLLNLNHGLGFTLAPVRYNAPPNVTVIQLMRD